MKRRFTSLLVAAVLGCARTALAASVEETIAKIAEAHRSISSMRARFVQERRLTIVRDVLRSSGIFVLDKSGRVSWRVESPESLRVVILAEGVFVDGKRVESGPEAFSPLPFLERMGRLFAGISEEVRREFDVGLPAPERLRLAPREPGLARWIRAIDITFDGPQRTPTHVRLEEPEGDVTEIRFSEIEVNPLLAPDTFQP
jgi:outer membrane lipoprotein-sorting protein